VAARGVVLLTLLLGACAPARYVTDYGTDGRLLGFRGEGYAITLTATTEDENDRTLRWWWWVIGPDYKMALASAEGRGEREVRIELPPNSVKRGDVLHFRVMFFGADGSETGQLETHLEIGSG
jgi:hypothetical protein